MTEAGRFLSERAACVFAEAEAAEAEALASSAAPRGLVRVAAPMSFGLREIAPALPDFLAAYPEISVDLNLSDAVVDLIGEGFDLALRIANLPDSSLVARRLCGVSRILVASPAYLERHGRPTHPGESGEGLKLRRGLRGSRRPSRRFCALERDEFWLNRWGIPK